MTVSSRTTNLSRIVHQMDANYERDKRIEPAYDFQSQSGRIFTAITAKSGPYENPPTGFLNGSSVGVTNLPGA